MDFRDLINSENYKAVNTAVVIAKQDAAIKNALNSLNELLHINKIEFTDFGKEYGLSRDLLHDIANLQSKLEKAKFGKL